MKKKSMEVISYFGFFLPECENWLMNIPFYRIIRHNFGFDYKNFMHFVGKLFSFFSFFLFHNSIAFKLSVTVTVTEVVAKYNITCSIYLNMEPKILLFWVESVEVPYPTNFFFFLLHPKKYCNKISFMIRAL